MEKLSEGPYLSLASESTPPIPFNVVHPVLHKRNGCGLLTQGVQFVDEQRRDRAGYCSLRFDVYYDIS